MVDACPAVTGGCSSEFNEELSENSKKDRNPVNEATNLFYL